MSRLPIIRHVRYFWHLWHVNKHYEMWQSIGRHAMNREHDYVVLDSIWRGER